MNQTARNASHRGGTDGRPVNSEILDRLPPHNLDAEKSVIGSMLLDPNVCDDVAVILRAEQFYAEAHEKLYGHIVSMRDSGMRIDATILMERLRKSADLEAIGGSAYLAELLHAVPYAANAVYYAEIVRDKATMRALIYASTEILRRAYKDYEEPQAVAEAAEQSVFAATDRSSTARIVDSESLMVAALDRIDARMDGKVKTGVPTGYVDLDKMTGGLHDSEFIVLAARPSMGKTALATNIAEYAAINAEIPTLFVSLEMAQLELADRLLSSQARIDSHKMRSGMLSKDDRTKLVEASARISRSKLFIDDDANMTSSQIAAVARRMKRQKSIGLVIVDYLQLIQPDDSRDPRHEQVAKVARRMKGLARELKIPVLCLAQLNRQADVGREVQRPRLHHLRESGCLAAGTLITNSVNGKRLSIENFMPGLNTWSYDGNRVVPGECEHVFSTGQRECFCLRTGSGREITATPNHKFLTKVGWKRLDEIVAGESVAALGTIPEPRKPTTSLRGRSATTIIEVAGLVFDFVSEIKAVGLRHTYDLTIAGHHNFEANGILAHNSIEQDADVVMFVHRDEYYCNTREEAKEKGVSGKAEIIVAKQRNGPTGTVKLAWLEKYTRFEALAKEYEPNNRAYSEFDEFSSSHSEMEF